MGSNPARGDEFLSLIKIRSTPSFEGEVKPHVIRFYGMLRNPLKCERGTS
jgi:hypothetical protein